MARQSVQGHESQTASPAPACLCGIQRRRVLHLSRGGDFLSASRTAIPTACPPRAVRGRRRDLDLAGEGRVRRHHLRHPGPWAAWLPDWRLLQARAAARLGAFLLGSNFLLEGAGRTELLDRQHPPTRVWTADLRLPMMHRAGWTGKRASSNTAYSWVVWDQRANAREFPRRFNWRDICSLPEWEGWL